ncbi:MAG TPA: M13 family metallopeptidase [Gammaproteobacteria bacterium]|nr:M13 family metallopeptidase [Gammaproteobacteria bacterium]
MKYLPLAAACTVLGLAACSDDGAVAPAATPAVATAKPAFGTFGIDTTAMDTSVKPGDDFYRYVNGKWVATFQMPPDKARYGAFDALRDKSETDVRTLLDELAAAPRPAGSVQQKVADLYGSWMDEAAIEARGIEPLKADLETIAAARTKRDIVALMGKTDYASPVALYISPDPADTTRYVVNVTQAGLGMPVRDYYLNEGAKFDAYRSQYRVYVTKIFELIGDGNPAASAEAVVALETELAKVHWSPERRRDVQATNNPVDRAGLLAMIPAVDWDALLPVAGLGAVQHFVVNETTALHDGAALLDTQPVETWKKYLAFHLADTYASDLPKAFDDASFEFYRRTLSGVEVQRDRWKRGVQLLDGLIGEGVGELYVAKYFPPDYKAKMDELVANLRLAMGQRLSTLSWMDEATRAEAQKKLGTFDPRVGYPVKWRDYSAYTVERGKLFENVRNGREFEWKRQVERLDEPVDRDEWGMNPQTVNAYYNPLVNQITFPAAILQPPFFDPNADLAVNYGAIGAVIGHEMGHGYDDQGREYDESGKIRNWWTPETNDKFMAAISMFAAQYNAFCPLDGACVNGNFTMGENIGDLGGLEMAYTAYKIALKGAEAPVIDGFTGDQRFFMAHAQVWRGIQREDALRSQMLTDPHSPAPARGSIPERNMDAWYAAFNVKEGDAQYLAPENRVRIW